MPAFTKTALRSRVFKALGQTESSDNELLTAADANVALELGEQQFARDTECSRRTATLLAVDEQAVYSLPEDLHSVIDIVWDDETDPLTEYDEFVMRRQLPDYRGDDSGTPSHWYQESVNTVRLYPKTDAPDGDETITIYGKYMPLSIGNGVAAASWTGGTATFTTTAAHRLRSGDSVVVTGMTPAGYDGTHTVTVTGAKTFTAAIVATLGVGTVFGYAYYAGGVLPMIADADTSSIPATYQMAIAHYAAWWLSENVLADDPVAVQAGERAAMQYEAIKNRYLSDELI